MYNGLTTADKGALLDAKARGAEWVVFHKSGEMIFCSEFPFISKTRCTMTINEALAQIAEMELTTNSTPLTWNEHINQMTVEEKARWMLNRGTEMHNESAKYAWDNASRKFEEMYIQRMIEFLASPYTEGENG